MNKHTFAKWGVIILFPPNALLTAIFFYLLIGNLSAIFGIDYGWWISIGIALMLGVGLVIGETVGHLTNAERNEHSPGIYLILILLAATNWGAGIYRSSDNAREQSITAISQNAKDDARYQSLLREKDNLEVNVLNDRREGNDIRAIDRQEKINEELKEIEEKYSEKASLLSAGGKWNILISLAFIVINLVYGLCVKAAYDGVSPAPRKKEPGILDKSKKVVHQRLDRALNNNTAAPATSHTAQQEEKIYGFNGRDEQEKKTELERGRGETYSSEKPVKLKYEDKSTAQRNESRKKSRRKDKIVELHQQNPNITIPEIMDLMPNSIRFNSRQTAYNLIEELKREGRLK